jgi:hypothetical protein
MVEQDGSGLSSDPRRLRTFTSLLQDNLPIPAAVADRLRALEAGAGPQLDEMRHALGFGVDFSGVWPAYAAQGLDFRRDVSEAQLAAVLDALYSAIAGSRVVHVIAGEAGPAPRRESAAIALREGESVELLVVWRNDAAASIQASAEARGFGQARELPPRRTVAFLLDAGPLPSGSYLLPLLLVAGGRPGTLDLPIECASSGRLAVQVVDAETGERVAARIYATDEVGALAPAGVVLRRDRHGHAWFHAEGAVELRASGRVRLRVARGIEYEHTTLDVEVPPGGRLERELRLERWSHMAADGWYSGDVHVHLNYGGDLALQPADAALAQRAEDVHLLNMMVANGGEGGIVLDDEHFTGAPHQLGGRGHLLRWGEEYRNNLYGHLCLWGIDRLTEPVFTGVRFSEHPDDWPPNERFASAARASGGTISYAHPVFDDDLGLDRIFAHARTVEAKELPVDAALGRIDAIDLLSYPGRNIGVARLWYRLLNCGLRLAATAGSDTFMNVTDATEMLGFAPPAKVTSPPAGVRVFTRVEPELTTEAWCASVRAGETFVTNGPMLALAVDAHGIGSRIEARAGQTLHVEATAGSYASMQRLELIAGGETVAEVVSPDGARQLRLEHDLVVARSGWVALRATGPAHEAILDEAVFAHTSPVYIEVEGAPPAAAADAAYFVEWIDRLCAMVGDRGRFASPAQRDDVLRVFTEARGYYADRTGGG